MAKAEKNIQPIIVKRFRRRAHQAHGGAWKIAYADFVTAMMAFFLLMWLLGSTSDGDLKGLAEYFKNPAKPAMTGGRSSGESTSLLPGGGKDLTQHAGQTKKTEVQTPAKPKPATSAAKAEMERQEKRKLAALSSRISALISSNPKLNVFSSQIRLEATPDGLQIQIIDDQKRPMFDTGSAMLKPYMREILLHIGQALHGVENKISLDGHTDQASYNNGVRDYSNWELSSDRANASRRELVSAGMADDKLARVVGFASSSLLDPQNPLNPMNRRISILVMNREAEERLMGVIRAEKQGQSALY